MSQNKIHVFINGKKQQFDEKKNLLFLLKSFNINNKGIAVEINLAVIPKSEYKKKLIKNNDKIEIVQFIGGG